MYITLSLLTILSLCTLVCFGESLSIQSNNTSLHTTNDEVFFHQCYCTQLNSMLTGYAKQNQVDESIPPPPIGQYYTTPVLLTNAVLFYVGCAVSITLWLSGYALEKWEDSVDGDINSKDDDQVPEVDEDQVGLLYESNAGNTNYGTIQRLSDNTWACQISDNAYMYILQYTIYPFRSRAAFYVIHLYTLKLKYILCVVQRMDRERSCTPPERSRGIWHCIQRGHNSLIRCFCGKQALQKRGPWLIWSNLIRSLPDSFSAQQTMEITFFTAALSLSSSYLYRMQNIHPHPIHPTSDFHKAGYLYLLFCWTLFLVYCLYYQTDQFLKTCFLRRRRRQLQRIVSSRKIDSTCMTPMDTFSDLFRPLEYTLTVPYVATMISIKHLICMTLFIIINALFVLYGPFTLHPYYKHYSLPPWGLLDRRASYVGMVNWSFAIVLGTRNSLLTRMSGLTFEALIPFHRWVSRVGLVEMLLHSFYRM